jgi:predicted RNase H-like HicB family nuclease
VTEETATKSPGHVYLIRADWDPDSQVWVAYSDEVPGLATGADTMEELIEKLKVVVPELLEENGLLPRRDGRFDVPFNVMAQRLERVHGAA